MYFIHSAFNYLRTILGWAQNFTELPRAAASDENFVENRGAKVAHEATRLRFLEAENIRKGSLEETQNTFREKLFESTKKIHNEAQKNPFLESLKTMDFDPGTYRQYLIDLYFVHRALEKGEKKLLGTSFSSFVFPELWRSNCLTKDIDAWGFQSEGLRASKSARAYGLKIMQITADEPEYLIPHMYAIYGGILFGGQSVKYKIQKAYEDYAYFMKSSPKMGNWYYTFPESVINLKKKWRNEINNIPAKLNLTPEQLTRYENRCKEEAISAFEALLSIINSLPAR